MASIPKCEAPDGTTEYRALAKPFREKTFRLRNYAVLVALSFLLLGTAFSQNSNVSGTVHDSDGHPLAGITVIGRHHSSDNSSIEVRERSDDQGHFEMKDVGRVIFFSAPKFEGLTHIRGVQEVTVDVSVVASTTQRWPVTCSNTKEAGIRYGSVFRFLVPHGTRLKHHNGDDTWDINIFFTQSKTRERAILWSGPMLGDGFVPDETILQAASFTQQGSDWRGKTKDGKNWRWYSSYEDLIHYENASDEAAAFFDRIIDSVCVLPLPVEAPKQGN